MKLTIRFSGYVVILMFLVGVVSNGYNKFYGQSLVTNLFYLNLSVQFYILLIVKLKTWVIYL